MRERTAGGYVVAALAVVLTLLFVFCRALSVELTYPFVRVARGISRHVLKPVGGLFDGVAAAAENARLRREVESLSMARVDAERFATENARLREVLEYAKRTEGEWLPAAVLSRGGANGSRTMLRINRGSFAGVTPGAVVSVPDGLVGLVDSVSPHTADVMLITDPSVMVACEVENPGGPSVRGVVAGGEDVLVFRHILGDAEDVAPRARVLTSGRGGVFPRGLAVGTLLQVRASERGGSRTGEVEPGVDFNALEDVFVRREK